MHRIVEVADVNRPHRNADNRDDLSEWNSLPQTQQKKD